MEDNSYLTYEALRISKAIDANKLEKHLLPFSEYKNSYLWIFFFHKQ